ncbi:spore germination protein [Priestia megaterium]|nr:spore germination protein [Priestia megaterium]
MPGFINIGTTRINSTSSNGSTNFGEVIHNGHTANTKSTGINRTYGDISFSSARMKNDYMDSDINDQTDIANVDGINGTQQ